MLRSSVVVLVLKCVETVENWSSIDFFVCPVSRFSLFELTLSFRDDSPIRRSARFLVHPRKTSRRYLACGAFRRRFSGC